jgi:hypothetical protein
MRVPSTVSLALLVLAALPACQPGTGVGPSAARSPVTGFDPAFDFEPPEEIAARLPAASSLRPLHEYADRLKRGLSASEARVCNWVRDEGFPAPRPGLVGYRTRSEFQFEGAHRPNDANEWFTQFAFYAQRASAHLLASPDSPVRRIMADAYHDFARADAALDLGAFVDASTGAPVAVPDIAAAVEVATAATVAYLLVEDDLPLSGAERTEVERWLADLFETYADGYRRWRPDDMADLRARWLLGQADMAWGLLTNDPSRFNRGAREAVRFLEFTRPDGAHRFGAARGYRALYYQGVSLNSAMDTLVLLESQGLPGRELILPTAARMAGFWSEAWDDHAVLWPYARENEGVPPGSDYRRQDRIEVAPGIDLFLALQPDHPTAARLRAIRAEHPYPTNYSATFNATCFAAALDGAPEG